MRRIGLLGGSFDPPHKGHIYISIEAKKLLQINEIWWLVTPQNPMKISEPATYQERIENFDFDMGVSTFSQSLSPGNEQRNYWHSSSANRPGSRNLIGVKDSKVDYLVENLISAKDRKSLIFATRALDRVLQWNHFVIPQWHIRSDRIAWWNKFGRPKKRPNFGIGFFSWWIDEKKSSNIQIRDKRSLAK